MHREPVVGADDAGACIYCFHDASKSSRRAHVYPTALYDNSMTLPSGVECDSCNEFAGSLEQALLSHNRIGPLIMVRGIPGRDGKTRRRIGDIQRDPASGGIRFHAVGRLSEPTSDGISIQFPDNIQLDEGRFRRALYHIGLNHLALVAGARLAREPKFNPVRRFVRYGEAAGAWRYAQTMYPDDYRRTDVGCHYLRGQPGTKIQIRTFIDDFFVDLEGSADLERWAGQTLPSGTGVL